MGTNLRSQLWYTSHRRWLISKSRLGCRRIKGKCRCQSLRYIQQHRLLLLSLGSYLRQQQLQKWRTNHFHRRLLMSPRNFQFYTSHHRYWRRSPRPQLRLKLDLKILQAHPLWYRIPHNQALEPWSRSTQHRHHQSLIRGDLLVTFDCSWHERTQGLEHTQCMHKGVVIRCSWKLSCHQD